MKTLRYTLIGDGSSDKILMNIIKWTIDDIYPALPSEGMFADFTLLQSPPQKKDVMGQVQAAKKYYPFDILFYHRDAESKGKAILQKRANEIRKYLNEDEQRATICIIPIKMTEAWLLFDENAIRKAAGNRNYIGAINLPDIKQIENENNPKSLLHDLLRKVSGLKGRNLKKFNVNYHVHLIAENIEDFSPLRQLSAYRAFEQEFRSSIDKWIKS